MIPTNQRIVPREYSGSRQLYIDPKPPMPLYLRLSMRAVIALAIVACTVYATTTWLHARPCHQYPNARIELPILIDRQTGLGDHELIVCTDDGKSTVISYFK